MNKHRAKELFMQGYSCAQAVACAFADECGLTEEQLKKASIAFGGGFIKKHSLCGALTGAALVAGLVSGGVAPSSKNDFAAAFKAVSDEFEAKHGSIICGELLADKQKLAAMADLSVATEEEYADRPCLALVMSAVDMTCEFLKSQSSK